MLGNSLFLVSVVDGILYSALFVNKRNVWWVFDTLLSYFDV